MKTHNLGPGVICGSKTSFDHHHGRGLDACPGPYLCGHALDPVCSGGSISLIRLPMLTVTLTYHSPSAPSIVKRTRLPRHHLRSVRIVCCCGTSFGGARLRRHRSRTRICVADVDVSFYAHGYAIGSSPT